MASNWGSSSFRSPPVPRWGLAGQTNNFMAGQAPLALQRNLPNYQANIAQRGANTNSLLRGQVPGDVVQQIQQTGAERGVATGSPGSPNANAAWLRALGLTSLGLQQQGSQQLSQSIADTPQPELWNPMSLYQSQLASFDELQAAEAGAGVGGGGLWGPRDMTQYSNMMGAGGGVFKTTYQ